MPECTAAEWVPANLIVHRDVRAWHRLGERGIPGSIEVLDGKGDRGVNRLVGIGPHGGNVIAKWCRRRTAEMERSIYQDILPSVGIPAVRCYGLADDEQINNYCFLFLEDAGDEEYSPDREENRVLAGRWLGALHAAIQQFPPARTLPDRGTDFYLKMLRSAHSMTCGRLKHSAFRTEDAEALRSIVARCDALAERWRDIERFCERMPRTLVHGDFVAKNARIQSGPNGKSLWLLDWEWAGWGVPAADLAQLEVGGLNPDLTVYLSSVRETWPRLDLTDVQQLAELGASFRFISAVHWANTGFAKADFKEEFADWYLAEMTAWATETAACARPSKG